MALLGDKAKRLLGADTSVGAAYFVSIWTALWLSLFCALTVPHFGGADERLHLDYAYQISHGRFPQFYEGTTVPLYRRPPPIQFVAHHPPLYYAVQAPLTRYFVDVKGDIRGASMSARSVNIAMGLLCVAALVWMGGVVGKGAMAYRIGIPAVFCTFLPFVKVSSLIFNDVLALLFAIITIGLSWRIARDGPSRSVIGLLGIISALGMATRATHVSVVAIACAAIPLHLRFVAKLPLYEAARRSVRPIAVVGGCVFITIGWFYLRNYSLSGSWTRVAPQSWAVVMNREYKDIYRVLSEMRMWLFPFYEPYGKLPLTLRAYVVAPIVGMLLAVFLIVTVRARKSLRSDQWVCGGLLLLVVALTYGQQIVHATGYGVFNPRYLILVFLVLAIAVVRALRELPPRLSEVTLLLLLLLGLLGAGVWSAGEIPISPNAPSHVIDRMVREVTVGKGVPISFVVLCVGNVIFGAAGQLVLWRQSLRPR